MDYRFRRTARPVAFMPYLDPIQVPTLSWGDVSVRLVRLRDARRLQQLLADNRGWLRQWEATHPLGRSAEPGSFPLRPSLRGQLRSFKDGSVIPLVLQVRGEVAGQVTVSELSQGALQSAQIGYWIAQEYAGQGAMPTAVALTVDYLFGALGLHRVEICLVPENVPSQRVVEKLGFRHEGTRERYIHIDGRWADHFAYALTTEDVPGGVLTRYLNR
ncbi:MAG: GNAT family N-acetyltransferase [Canibacter sp.]